MAIGDGKTAVLTIAISGAVTVQPPSGEEWLLRDIGNSAMTSSDGYPKGTDIGLYDGSNYSTIRHSLTSDVWVRKLALFFSNSVYLRMTASVAGQGPFTVTYSALVTKVSGTTAGRADAQLAVTSVAASAYATIQPSAGQTWSVTEIGSDKFDATSSVFPNVAFSQYDGSNTIYIYQPTTASFTRPWNAVLSNSVYGRIQNLDAATALISYSAIRMS